MAEEIIGLTDIYMNYQSKNTINNFWLSANLVIFNLIQPLWKSMSVKIEVLANMFLISYDTNWKLLIVRWQLMSSAAWEEVQARGWAQR